MNKPNPKLLEAHIDAGHDLFPLNKGQKTPRDRGWRTNDYTGENPRSWMSDGFNVGVRLRPSEVVIDLDPRNSDRGSELMDEFCREVELDPGDHFTVTTPGGGLHVHAHKLEGLKVAAKVEAWRGVDVKTEGGFVVASGSVHPNGGLYRAVPNWLGLFEVGNLPPKLIDAISKQAIVKSDVAASQVSCDDLEGMLAALDPADFREHDSWLRLMMSCHHETGGAGKAEFIAWSTSDLPYAGRSAEIAKRWDSLDAQKPGGVTCRTLYGELAKVGAHHLIPRTSAAEDFAGLPVSVTYGELRKNQHGKPTQTLNNCIVLVNDLALGLAYDELNQRPVMRAADLPWRADIGREVNDEAIRQIRVLLTQQHGVELTKETVTDACLFLASNRRFNPVTDYLDALAWDGAERIDTWLSEYLGAGGSEYSRAVGRATLIAAVRRARKPGSKFDTVLVLEGAQGTGKSSALKVLGGEWFSDAELGRVDNKDAPLVLQGVWVHELGELNALGRPETEALKAFVSRCEDRYRAPYDRSPKTEPRRCIFVGTTNSSAYLRDSTGNRRFWPVRTGAIDLAALRGDRDQLWAEAAHFEALGERIELPQDLWDEAAKEQAERQIDDPWRDVVSAYVASNKLTKAFSRDLLERALSVPAGQQSQVSSKRLREVMASLGWRHVRSIRVGQEVGAGYEREPGETD